MSCTLCAITSTPARAATLPRLTITVCENTFSPCLCASSTSAARVSSSMLLLSAALE